METLQSDSGSSSPLMASPKICAPWAKYNPSPSHASPSAGILKRKRVDDTPSSAEVGAQTIQDCTDYLQYFQLGVCGIQCELRICKVTEKPLSLHDKVINPQLFPNQAVTVRLERIFFLYRDCLHYGSPKRSLQPNISLSLSLSLSIYIYRDVLPWALEYPTNGPIYMKIIFT